MKINEVRILDGLLLVNTQISDKEFAYSQVENNNETFQEVFEVYHLDDSRPSGFRYSRSYNLTEGQQPPKKYIDELEFLKTEFNKINWDAKYVEYKLSLAK